MAERLVSKSMSFRLSVSPWAALAAGLLCYFSDAKTLFLLALPILVHELGHWVSLRLFGCRICAMSLELSGLCIRYTGDPGRWGRAISALAGPLAGLTYAWIAAHCGVSGQLSAGISLLLSAFNLIPAQPLDGGRAAEALLSRSCARTLSVLSAIITAVAGLALFFTGRGATLALAGAVLLAWQEKAYGSSSPISPD